MGWFLRCLNQYADFNGRARRKEYWMFFVFNFLMFIVFIFIGYILKFSLFIFLYMLGMFVPSLAVSVRRMHDTNHSGWFLFVPFYNLYLLCIDGDQRRNRYGNNPKA